MISICCAVVALLAVGFVGINAAHIAQDGIRNIREDSLVGISLLAVSRNCAHPRQCLCACRER